MPDFRQLLRDAYFCKLCPTKFGFRFSPIGSYFKFPPMIGATHPADILFVGINPRRSSSNHSLHNTLMTSKEAFKNLASNRINDKPYIHPSSDEPHYHDHLEIIRRVYGDARSFESCAAVTELFLCATAKSDKLPYPDSQCADHFLPLVLDIVQPKAMVAVGSRVMRYFKTKPAKFRASDEIVITLAGHNFPVVRMPHPANKRISESQRRSEINDCVHKLRKLLGCS
jgi:uracil-DNA glycosylase